MTDIPAVNIRDIVLQMLIETFENGQYSHIVLSSVLEKYSYVDVKMRKFLTRLYEGTVEYCFQADAVLNRYSKTRVVKMKPVIRNILRLGVYQLLYMDSVPDSAVCNECVKLSKKRGLGGLSGFVNGVLRNIARDKSNIHFNSLSEKYSVPNWIIEEWKQYYDEEMLIQILEGFRENNGLSIRVNTTNVDYNSFCSILSSANIQYVQNPFVKNALWISEFNSINSIPGFDKGYFQIQNACAMIPVIAAGIKKKDYVLDVCAAPGGKAIQAADMLNGSGYVEARDLTEYKVSLIEENIARNGFTNIKAVCADATQHDVNSEQKYDVVLADLPCSGLGVIGTKHDIKYRVKKDDIFSLAKLQKDILSVVSKYVKKGGTLIFSTCTISRTENEENVKWILDNLPFELADFSNDKLFKDNCSIKCGNDGYVQLLPGLHKGDGCFVAKFVRVD